MHKMKLFFIMSPVFIIACQGNQEEIIMQGARPVKTLIVSSDDVGRIRKC